jgi:REP element-mobilizing transposase RayT
MQSKGDGWHKRKNLPHFHSNEVLQFITFKLIDSVPRGFVSNTKVLSKQEIRHKIEKCLDAGYGSCYLKDPNVAKIIQDSLLYHNGSKYDLISWVIMPNHVHLLVRPANNHSLSDVLHSIKSFTSHKANAYLGRKGQFWQHEYFDRFIRNEKHYNATISYIENNPVKANLCRYPAEWPFGSAKLQR